MLIAHNKCERKESTMAEPADDDSRLFGGIVLSALIESRAGDDCIDFSRGWLSKASNVDTLSNEDSCLPDGVADSPAASASEVNDAFTPMKFREGDNGNNFNFNSGWLSKAANVDTLSDEDGYSPHGAACASTSRLSEATALSSSIDARAGDDGTDFDSGWLSKAANVDTLSNEDGYSPDGAADASAARISDSTDLFALMEASTGDDGTAFSNGWLSKAANVNTPLNEDDDSPDGAADVSATRASEATTLFALREARAGDDGIHFNSSWLSKAAHVEEDDDSPGGAANASAARASETTNFPDLDFIAESFIQGSPESRPLNSGIVAFEQNQGEAADGGEAHLIGSLFQTLNFEDTFEDASEGGEMAAIQMKGALTSQEQMHPQLWDREEEHLKLKEDVIGMAFDQQPKLRANVKEFVPASERTKVEQYPAIKCNQRKRDTEQLIVTGQSVIEEGQTIAGGIRKYVHAAEDERCGDVSLAAKVIALAIKDNRRKQKIPREQQKSLVEREFRRVGMPMKDEAKKLGLSLKDLFQQREEVARNIGLTYSQLAEMLGKRRIKLALRDESILAENNVDNIKVDASGEQREREQLTIHWNNLANRIIFYAKKLEYNSKKRQPSKSERKERVEEQFRKLGLPSKCEANAMGISSKVVIKHRAEVARRIGMPYDVLCQRLGDRKLELILDENVLAYESDQSDACTADMDGYRWKQPIPEAAVDPKSLALLDELKYPLFHHQGATFDSGIYNGEDRSGHLIIDNNHSPGLQWTLQLSPHDVESNRDALQTQSHHFPSLPHADGVETFPLLPEVAPTNLAAKQAWSKGPSKSLSQISKSIAQHDPVLVEKQRKANALAAEKLRELEGVKAKRYTKLAKLGLDSSAKQETPTEAFKSAAKALSKTGWTRLVSGTAELNPAEYSDSLLSRAKLHMPELIKLERQLVRFLVDGEAPSLALKPMKSRSIRKFFNDYCKCWKLHTKSYDASPRITQKGVYKDPDRKLYVQCDKLDNTCAPFPLLSDAVRDLEYRSVGDISKKQKKKKKKKVVDPCDSIAEGRVPLKLLPRTIPGVDALCRNPKETRISKAILMEDGFEVQSLSMDTDSA